MFLRLSAHRHRAPVRLILAACAYSCGSVFGVKTESMEELSYNDFIRGTFTSLELSNRGDLSPGHYLQKIADIEQPVIWTAINGPAGSLYLGTANRGEVIRVDADGEITPVFNPDAALTRALVMDADGNLFAGVSPSGRVYRIRPGERPEIYFDPPADYIWDLLLDDDGRLFVATGAPAKIYCLPADFSEPGQAELWFSTDTTHITRIHRHPVQGLLAGTSPKAFLFHVVSPDEARALYHAPGDEITGIFTAGGDGIFFSTLNRKGPPGAFAESTPLDLPALLDKMQSGDGNNAKDNGQELPSFLMRLGEDGFAEPVWTPGGQNLFALAPFADGGFIAGTDSKGQLFQIADATDWRLLGQSPNGGEISFILNRHEPGEDDRTYVFTSNPAAVFLLRPAAVEDAVFTSRVIDARISARWGILRPIGSGATPPAGISWRTRTGNTPEPDATWNEWMAPADMRVANPPGRYLQYEATFTPDADTLRGLRLFYLYRNAAPIVSNIHMFPVGIDVFSVTAPQGQPLNLNQITGSHDEQPALPQPPVRRQFRVTGESGHMTAGWHAVDPNRDELIFTVAIRALDDDAWLTLAEDLGIQAHSFNTRGFADGYYELKVKASDAPSNPPGTERTGYLVSRPFLINNTPPRITLLASESGPGARTTITLEARSAFSVIQSARYILNGNPPLNLLPDDLIFDSTHKSFTLELKDLQPGNNSLIVEVEDENKNRGVLKTFVRTD